MNGSVDEAFLTPSDASGPSVSEGAVPEVGPGAAAPRDGGERAGWFALLALGVVGLLALGIGLASRDAREPLVIGSDTESEQVASGRSAVLEVTVDNATVSLSGELPDDGAVAQAIDLATARFGEGNVTSSLVANSSITLVGGVVNVSGIAEEGDQTPNGLQSDLAAAFGLEAGGFEITRTEAAFTPVRADAVVAAGVIELSGAFPDQAAVDQYILAAETVYGVENVRGANVIVDRETTLTGATFGISGLVDAGDTRATEFQNTVLAFFGANNADTTGLEIDTSPEALARLEDRLRAEVAQEPILFASGQATIDAESAPILERLALAINATPGVDVEVVGHTDGEGAVEINQEISERRAQAVVDRLVLLGVDVERLRARGAGESEPIGDNDTEEGRAQNRRIAFEFDGAS
jgi:outer membrane protein OmpA-like peptidoglycan-associated protein